MAPRVNSELLLVGSLPAGVTALHWDSWPRIDDAIAGYQVFRALRAEGVIPAGLRFQVGLPFPSSALARSPVRARTPASPVRPGRPRSS